MILRTKYGKSCVKFCLSILLHFFFSLFLFQESKIAGLLLFLTPYLLIFYKPRVLYIKDDKIICFSFFRGVCRLDIRDIVKIQLKLFDDRVTNIIKLELIDDSKKKSVNFPGGDLQNTKMILNYLIEHNKQILKDKSILIKLKE